MLILPFGSWLKNWVARPTRWSCSASVHELQNLFDPSTNFMRGRNEDGSWQSPFIPEAWGGAFTEGSSWHYTGQFFMIRPDWPS
jgi:hypothetical protein